MSDAFYRDKTVLLLAYLDWTYAASFPLLGNSQRFAGRSAVLANWYALFTYCNIVYFRADNVMFFLPFPVKSVTQEGKEGLCPSQLPLLPRSLQPIRTKSLPCSSCFAVFAKFLVCEPFFLAHFKSYFSSRSNRRWSQNYCEDLHRDVILVTHIPITFIFMTSPYVTRRCYTVYISCLYCHSKNKNTT